MQPRRIVHCPVAHIHPINGASAPHWNGALNLHALDPKQVRQALRRLILPAVKEAPKAYATWNVSQLNVARVFLEPKDRLVVEVHDTAPANAAEAQAREVGLMIQLLPCKRRDLVTLIRTLQTQPASTREAFGGNSDRHLCRMFGLDPRTLPRADRT